MSILDTLKTLNVAELQADIQKRKDDLSTLINATQAEIGALELVEKAVALAQQSALNKPVMVGLMSLEQIRSGAHLEPRQQIQPSVILSPTGFEVTREQRPDLWAIAKSPVDTTKTSAEVFAEVGQHCMAQAVEELCSEDRANWHSELVTDAKPARRSVRMTADASGSFVPVDPNEAPPQAGDTVLFSEVSRHHVSQSLQSAERLLAPKHRATMVHVEKPKQTTTSALDAVVASECGYADLAATYLEAAGPSSVVAIGIGASMDEPRRMAGILQRDSRFEKTDKGFWKLAGK